ncbi:MAG: DNA polymerase III subunit delta [Oscillospiraceae bacterium]|jgi:DNA polymerase-3 subunit delta|nr:DNA polymerase III subunit delta [Oscillospiraceae bacterium]
MAKKKTDNSGYAALRAAISSGKIGRCYVFHGEERYLLERSAADVRRAILPDGEDGFNCRRYSSPPGIDELRDAVDTLPFFAERTLVEVSDFDFSSGLDDLLPILRELPEHVCLLFICDTVAFKADKRQAAAKELFKLAEVVEFGLQEQAELTKWIRRHFKDAGRQISPADTEYLAFLTGGLMSNLINEIEKLTAHASGETVTRADIDALVTPTPDVELYKFTDAVAARDFRTAASILDELIAMREVPHRISYALTSKMRSLLLARLYLDGKRGTADLMSVAGVKYEFQARNLFAAARKLEVRECKNALRLCCEIALRLNDGGGMEGVVELLARLAAA